jgi:hypothetical protein
VIVLEHEVATNATKGRSKVIEYEEGLTISRSSAPSWSSCSGLGALDRMLPSLMPLPHITLPLGLELDSSLSHPPYPRRGIRRIPCFHQ